MASIPSSKPVRRGHMCVDLSAEVDKDFKHEEKLPPPFKINVATLPGHMHRSRGPFQYFTHLNPPCSTHLHIVYSHKADPFDPKCKGSIIKLFLAPRASATRSCVNLTIHNIHHTSYVTPRNY